MAIGTSFSERYQNIKDWWQDRRWFAGFWLWLLVLLLLVAVGVGIYWSGKPDTFSVHERAAQRAQAMQIDPVIGFTSTATLIELIETLLHKPGGFISNDIAPPGVWLDNISNWEHGVLVQARDFSRALRKDFSRSQSQSVEDKDLAKAEPLLHFDSKSWAFPSSESEYRRAVSSLNGYLTRLVDTNNPEAQFYTRADNLRRWLLDVETRLGSLSQRLSASVGKARINTDLAGDAKAQQSTPTQSDKQIKTPWLQIDDVFYEARGSAWALAHLLRAVEIDFHDVLDNKNALISLRQIIRELDATQETLWSPMVMNGSGFGMFANHSLVMASYISRANAAIKDLNDLLAQG